MILTPHCVNDDKPAYLGLPIKVISAFHWREEIEGRETPATPAKKRGPKSKEDAEKAVIAFRIRGSIEFSKSKQADADKTARIQGRHNKRRTQ